MISETCNTGPTQWVDESTAPGSDPEASLLAVRELDVAFGRGQDAARVVRNVSFDVPRGATVGLVGESGSGKSVTCSAIMGLTELRGGRVTGGSVEFEGVDLVGASKSHMRKVRGGRIGMVFQQPMRSLNPAFTVGDQIAEAARAHLGLGRSAARDRSIEMLDRVRIPSASKRVNDYPHQFSGGMAQRVMIAMALVCEPSLLIADEPTTALDVTVQAHVLQLLRDIQDETGISMLFVSHDLGVIAEVCHRVVVMYAGEVVEEGSAAQLFSERLHPYSQALFEAVPTRGRRGERLLSLPGSLPSPRDNIDGCRFHPRCEFAMTEVCTGPHPEFVALADGRGHRCARSIKIGTLT